MKKILFVSALVLMGVVHLSAQNVVTGKVLDEEGNPIPGAKVEVPGSSDFVLSRLDGTFTLETEAPAKKVKVYYGGMRPKTMPVADDDVVVNMHQSRQWSFSTEGYETLLSLQIALPELKNVTPSYGVMVGGVKEGFGWYAKGFFSKCPETVGVVKGSRTGDLKTSYTSITAGFLGQLWSPIYFYAGLGYSSRKVAIDTMDGCLKVEDESYGEMAVDLGLMARYKRFFISAGTTLNRLDDSPKFVGNFGLGVFF